jgi:rubrerythrin
MAKWECRICLYQHEGEEPPDDCPVCGAPAKEFTRLEGED